MTFEALNDTVMLVELSQEEMTRYHITYDTLESGSIRTQTAVKDILSVIKISEKFNTRDKITVEALPTDCGGCFFIFTFLPKKKTRYRIKKDSEYSLFSTDKIDNLLDFIGVLKTTYPTNRKHNIYKMNNRFYMQFSMSSKNLHALASEFVNISNEDVERLHEFGEKLGSVSI